MNMLITAGGLSTNSANRQLSGPDSASIVRQRTSCRLVFVVCFSLVLSFAQAKETNKKTYSREELKFRECIDTQPHAGNRWLGTYASNYGAVNMNDSSQFNLSSSLFIIDPNLGSDYSPAIPADTLDPPFYVNDQGWFDPGTGTTFSCYGQYACNAFITGGGSEDLKRMIARDSTLTAEFIPESKTIAKQYLYKAIQEDSALLAGDAEFEQFIDDYKQENIGYLFDSGKLISESENLEESAKNAIAMIDSLMKIYADSLFHASVSNTALQQLLKDSLSSLSEQRNNLIMQAMSNIDSLLNEAGAKNALVHAGDEPEMNEKLLNEVTIIYRQQGKEAIASYYNTLLAIAIQCPYKGGKAVYQARAYLKMFNDTIEYDDAGACLQEGIYRNTAILKLNNILIQVNPNPAFKTVDVKLLGMTEGVCKIRFTNILGEVVYESSFNCIEKLRQINISFLKAGIYNLSVDANGKLVNKKMVIFNCFPLMLLLLLFWAPLTIIGQGFNKTWLLGTDTGLGMGRMEFDSNSYTLILQQRKMTFKGTQATISEANGNFLMSSNGVWIANALNDTMQNGSGLNPSWDVNAHPNGLLIKYGNVFLPFPGDSDKYVLFHHAEFDPDPFSYFGGIHKSVIDITQDGGLGAVIQKNDTLIQDQLTWGMAACKHANGRDWWVIAQKDSSDIVYKILLTPNGIENITTQNLGYSFFYKGNAAQITFSQDGTKFIQCNYFYVGSNHNDYFIISDFDRCTGIFSNTQTILIATNSFLFGLAFSPSGKYAYTCTSNSVYQIDTDNMTWQTVANYDGFCFPNPPWCTNFFNMYLAANGKIYITAGNGVQHLHEMNYPDSAGTACDVQQHSIYLNGIWYLRSVPNHPNYYLGPVAGSVCDTLGLGVAEQSKHDFRFSVSPNPNNGSFQIMYLLPQGKSGVFEVYDINGRKVYEQRLPPWSTMQQINLNGYSRSAPVALKGAGAQVAEGIYQCVITSDGKRVGKKVAVMRE